MRYDFIFHRKLPLQIPRFMKFKVKFELGSEPGYKILLALPPEVNNSLAVLSLKQPQPTSFRCSANILAHEDTTANLESEIGGIFRWFTT